MMIPAAVHIQLVEVLDNWVERMAGAFGADFRHDSDLHHRSALMPRSDFPHDDTGGSTYSARRGPRQLGGADGRRLRCGFSSRYRSASSICSDAAFGFSP